MRAALFALLLAGALRCFAVESVVVARVPDGGTKPAIVLDERGSVHLVYFKGDPKAGDAWYSHSEDDAVTWSKPIRVNSQPGSVIGVTAIRGPRIALGRGGKVHVLWNGSNTAQPRAPLNPAMPADSPFNGTPLLYSRLDFTGRAFEPQRNLMTKTCALDGGSDIAADGDGYVYAVWHAMIPGAKGEAERTVWLACSNDDGVTFAAERNVVGEPTGACGCCSLSAVSYRAGHIDILYRGAKNGNLRGVHYLTSNDHGEKFSQIDMEDWRLQACPMSSMTQLRWDKNSAIAFEYDGKLLLTRPVGRADPLQTQAGAKYPALARNIVGDILIASIDGAGWNKGGKLTWQLFRADKSPAIATGGGEQIPAHGNVAAFARADGKFVILF